MTGVTRAAALGDKVTIDFVGKIDGQEFEGGKGENFALVLGEGRLLKDFEDSSSWAWQPGINKTFEIRFPDDYHGKELAGKTATFDVNVKAGCGTALAAVDADFAKSARRCRRQPGHDAPRDSGESRTRSEERVSAHG